MSDFHKKDTESYLLSVLIPTWRRDTTILKLLDSIPLEFFKEIEVIIVDNGSEEKYVKNIKDNIASNKNIHFYHNTENIGMVRNWNRCIELAQGRWMTLMCSDDLYAPDAIRRGIEIIKKLPGPHLILQDPTIKNELEFLPAAKLDQICLPLASGNFWHREITDKLGGYCEALKYSPDAEFWFRMAKHYPVLKVKQSFAIYNQHEDNFAFSTYRNDDFLEQVQVLENMLSDLKGIQSKSDGKIITAKTIMSICLKSKKHKDLAPIYFSRIMLGEYPILTKLKFFIWTIGFVLYIPFRLLRKIWQGFYK